MASEASVDHRWYLVDAKDKTLGRLATMIATYLRGKHKVEFTPHADTGDYIVVVNAAGLSFTGRNKADKPYYRHTGYFGGIKSESLAELMARAPEQVLEKAVKGMLPKGPLGRKMLAKLKIYAGAEHPHQAQNPSQLEVVK
ncbi:MAG TPA: 50S ribosomal protein L13 [Coxiellaceae bacterium]|nr:50S ribosomal protein L13 [Coxiellaceae bacterium]